MRINAPPHPARDIDAERQRVVAALAALDDAAIRWPALTAAQRTAAMHLCIRVVVALARLVLARLG